MSAELSGTPDHIAEQIATVEAYFPDLASGSYANGATSITGRLPLVDELGCVFDTWVIEVLVPDNFPRELPTVLEIGGRIPRDPDRHMNIGGYDGECCIGVGAEIYYRLGADFSLLEFIQGPVTAFFLGQALVEGGKPWPQGERPHGTEGIVAFLREAVGVPDTRLMKWLRILAMETLKPRMRCPCGRRRPVRDCHFAKIYTLRKRLPPHEMQRILSAVGEWIAKRPEDS